MSTIKLLKRAEFELTDSAEWYEKQQVGLSDKFLREIDGTLQIISTNPKLYSKKYNTYLQFAPLKKFPFVIVHWYNEKIDTVIVTSIFHTKRNPKQFEN